MASVFYCPTCRHTYSIQEAFQNGSICPNCKKLLRSRQGEEQPIFEGISEPVQTEGHQAPADTTPNSYDQMPSRTTRSRSELSGDDVIALQVKPVKGKSAEISKITQLLNSIAGTVSPLCLEISGDDRQRMFIIRCKRKHAGIVTGAVIGAYGSPELSELEEEHDPARLFTNPDNTRGYARLVLEKSAGLPLKTWRELTENDPVLPLVFSVWQLEKNEAGIIQLLIPDRARPDWARKYKRELTAFKRKQLGVPGLATMGLIVMISFSALCLLSYMALGWADGTAAGWLKTSWMPVLAILGTVAAYKLFGRSDIPWSESLEEIVSRKVNQQAYTVEIRLAAASPRVEKVESLLNVMSGAFKQFGFETGNSLIPFRPQDQRNIFNPKVLYGDVDTQFVLGDEEIATIWHLPMDGLPDLLSASRVDDTMPDPETVSNASGGWRIGEMGKSGKTYPVYIPRSAITRKHSLMMGKTQQGKSTLLLRIITELARDNDRSLLVIDPHDDLITSIIEAVPQDRVDDVIYLNFADSAFIPGFNILDIAMFEGDPERTKEAFLDVAKSLFGRFWGPRMQVNFDKTMHTLALANTIRDPEQQFTILSALQLLTMSDSEMRLRFLESVLPKTDPMYETLISYWRDEFDELTPQMREAVRMPVLSKLRPFEGNKNMMGIFGQPTSSFNIIDAILGNKIILVRTGATLLSEEYSDFIGSFILNWARRALFSQGELPAEQRSRATIVVDESQSFTGIDYSSFLAQVAKYGANLILTTQGTKFIGRALSSDQINDTTAWSTVMANIDTLIIFRIDGEDAQVLCRTEFTEELEAPSLINTKSHSAFVRFSNGKEVVGPFLVQLDPPVEGDYSVKQQILARRANYSNPKPEALQRALDSMSATREFVLGRGNPPKSYAGSINHVSIQELTQRAIDDTDANSPEEMNLLDLLSNNLNPESYD